MRWKVHRNLFRQCAWSSDACRTTVIHTKIENVLSLWHTEAADPACKGHLIASERPLAFHDLWAKGTHVRVIVVLIPALCKGGLAGNLVEPGCLTWR